MDIGSALKKIRTDRGLSQKEMCKDVVTVSYYSKVERGIHQISADSLFVILQENDIHVNEFLKLVNLQDLYGSARSLTLSNEIEQAYYHLDITQLNQIKENLNNLFSQNDYDYIFYNHLIQLIIFYINQDHSLLTDENKDFFKQKIFNSNTWDAFTLGLYNNMIQFYDLESNLFIIHSIISKHNIIDTEPFLVETILINFVRYCIENDKDHYGISFFATIDSIKTTPSNFFNKAIFTFFKNLIFYREKPDYSFLENIEQAISTFNFLNMPEYGIKLNEFYQKYK